MEFFLNKVSQQAVSFAIRTGIVVTSNFAIKQCSRYMSSVKGRDREELKRLQDRLETKIRIISPAIDLVEIISARGNTSLESALTLTKALRRDIQDLGQRLANLTTPLPDKKKRSRSPQEVKEVMDAIKNVLDRIEDAVPFISLAVTTSGVNISSSLPHSVSPSRLLQASTLLSAGDTAYANDPFNPGQIGTTFTLSLYMLFASHAHRKESVTANDLTWQEVISKCRVKLQRVPLFYGDDHGEDTPERFIRAQRKLDEYCYELTLIEDLDDGRVHDVEPEPFEDVKRAGMRARIPIHQISKMFYTTSGKLLGIEDSSSPILLIKRNKNAQPPRRLVQRATDFEYDYSDEEDEEDYHALDLHEDQSDEVDFPTTRGGADDLPGHLDPEWLAFEIWEEPRPDDDSETEPEDEDDASSATLSFPGSSPPSMPALPHTKALSTRLASLDLAASPATPSNPYPRLPRPTPDTTQKKNALSILECLLRLTILQNYQQSSHLNVTDELLNLFLSDAAWDGNPRHRAQEREKARSKLGFDPFGSSPVEHHEHYRPEARRSSTEPPSSMKVTPKHSRGSGRKAIADRLPDSGLPMSPSSAAVERARVRVVRRERVEEWTPERQLSGEWASSPVRPKGSSMS